MDIRNFFGVKNKSKSGSKPGSESGSSHQNGKGKRKRMDEDDDDFVVAETPPRHVSKPAKMKKSNIIYDSDSDEETAKPSKTKKNTSVSKPTRKQESKLPTPSPTKSKATTVLDFFGASPIQRSSKKTPSSKRTQPEDGDKTKKLKLDLEEHDDEDFAKTLKELDAEHSPPLESARGGGKGLASKLAAKVRGVNRVPETPDRDGRKETDRQRDMVIEETPVGSKPNRRVKSETTAGKPSPSKGKASPSKSTVAGKTSTVTESKHTPSKTTPEKKSGTKVSPPAKAQTPAGEGDKRRGNPGYRSYLNREGPRSLGAREVPKGADGCLEGLTFVITGVLEYFDKDEVKTFIEKYGGRVTGSISKKTTHLIVGRDPGESKISKATEFKTKQLPEDDLYDLIETRPGKGKSKGERSQTPAKSKQIHEEKKPDKQTKSNSQETRITKELSKPSVSATKEVSQSSKPPVSSNQSEGASVMWVDKYKPTSTKSIIGQHGDKSNAKKLMTWLRRWQDNNFGNNKDKAKYNRDDGFAFKAALLSGPPGIGKTTTATLACQETGFSYFEMNASDARSKKTLQGVVSEYLGNQTLGDMFRAQKTQKDTSHQHCLIMDEVDGTAGNEDRGGIQELIQMIKHTHVPVICICNDRSHPKIRSLVHHCFDLRFQRPRVPQIKAAMLSVAFKEGISIPSTALDNMILASNQDIRQVLHNMSMWSAGQSNLSAEQVETDAKNAKKDLKLGPWDVLRQVFSSKDAEKMSFNDKMDLFFHDYSIAPLFVQENYISVVPSKAKGDVKKHLDLLSKAADSLCLSDLVEKTIRSRSHWRLLPTQAVFASVIPGSALQGYMGHMINFPSWLGKNSTRGKNFRLLQELQIHMRRRTSASIQDLNQEYLPCLRRFLTNPLIERETEGVGETVQLMDDYDLLKEDLDSLLEVTQYTGYKEPMSRVPTKVKSALTRTYNKGSHMTPYAISGDKKKKGRGGGGAAGFEDGPLGAEEGEEKVEEASDDDDVTTGGMVKVKQKSASNSQASSSKGKSSKGKAPVKGKAPTKGRGRSK